MKNRTTLETIIFRIEEMLILDCHCEQEENEMKKTMKLLKRFFPMEQSIIEAAYDDGVNEAMRDPERPFTGKEYYHIIYKK